MRRLVFLAIFSFVISSCGKDDDDSDLPPFQDIITQGTWVVNNYMENGVNKTGDYNGNTFKFNVGGALVATKGGNNFNGNWSVISSVQTFSFTINTFDVQLIALGGDWVVTAASLTDLQFKEGNDILALHKQ